MNALHPPLRVLVDPVDAVAPAVTERRWLVPLLLLIASTLFGGVCVAARFDAKPQVLAELGMSGKLGNMSEADIVEAIQTAERVKLIGAVAFALLAVPVLVLVIAGWVKLLTWLLGWRARYMDLFTALTLGLMPIALSFVVLGVCALWQFQLHGADIPRLVPSHLGVFFPHASPKLHRVLSGVDFFGLWAAALVGLGVASAAKVRPRRGLILGFALYAAYVGLVVIALPSMGGGHS